ncbi:uncharacterized protein RJT21DRAFT_113388 [Scheffersomyces amazonensis]|uniref:uncharacterized protein n=1 Tax=Scheffersomyces amazonensis TaxID=1078765 RepID=UPI00315CEFB1
MSEIPAMQATVAQEAFGSPTHVNNEPPRTEMTYNKEEHHDDSGASSESSSLDDNHSGYERHANECTEFCIELFTCFGLFNACCPANGEGCLTSTATFCGNILFACCKC